MKTIFFSVVIYVVGVSLGSAYHDVSLFYPWILQGCIKDCSWTTWFNIGKPYNSSSGDSEDTAEIITQNPETMCKRPIGIEAQSINYQTGSWNYEWRLTETIDNISLVSFYSTEPVGVDFRVRYCCSSVPLISTTTTMVITASISSDNSTCGIQEIKPQTNSLLRLSDHVEATAHSWPWMVYLHKPAIRSDETCSVDCSAILIDKNHLITTAHCVAAMDPTNMTLIAGAHDLSSTIETDTRQVRTIKQIILHSQYNSSTTVNDIAVLRMDTAFIFTKYVQPICLPDDKIQPSEKVVAIGWRKRKQFGDANNKILKQVFTTIVDDCNFYWPFHDNNHQLCVSGVFNRNSECRNNADEAIFSLRSGRYILEGIASATKEDHTVDQGHKPVVYTRISTFRTWIDQIVHSQKKT